MRGDRGLRTGPQQLPSLARTLAAVDSRVRGAVRDAVRRQVRAGATAIALGGSWVRGEAHRGSDVDLWVVVDRGGHRSWVERRGPNIVAYVQGTADWFRGEFDDPRRAGGAVPAWREACRLYDPRGVADRLRSRALAWTGPNDPTAWERYVTQGVAGLAEEVGRLVGHLEARRPWVAAVQRNILATELAAHLAAHFRILYGSENRLWDSVADRMGNRWRRAFALALGVPSASVEASCRASLTLYRLAARELDRHFDRRERAAVRWALERVASAGKGASSSRKRRG